MTIREHLEAICNDLDHDYIKAFAHAAAALDLLSERSHPAVPYWFQDAFQKAFRDHETYGEGVDDMWDAVRAHGHAHELGWLIALDDEAEDGL